MIIDRDATHAIFCLPSPMMNRTRLMSRSHPPAPPQDIWTTKWTVLQDGYSAGGFR
jgi:hypothetical protein